MWIPPLRTKFDSLQVCYELSPKLIIKLTISPLVPCYYVNLCFQGETSTFDKLFYLYRDMPLRKSQDLFKISFKLKPCSFVLVLSLFKKEINAFDSFGIE